MTAPQRSPQSAPLVTLMQDQKRLHLNHGPIDLIIGAFGTPAEVAKAYRKATMRFQTILEELVEELPLLRSAINANSASPNGRIARTMHRAALEHKSNFITPMAAVAGAVADEMLATMCEGTQCQRIFVNNGGDIALWLRPLSGESFRVGVVADPRTGDIVTMATIVSGSTIGGIATSGRHGRSHSLGIADAVTVFAETAASADAAATIIANAVDLPGHPAIGRTPANRLSPDSDLGEQLVTTSVSALTREDVAVALENGAALARHLCRTQIIEASFLSLDGNERIFGWPRQPARQRNITAIVQPCETAHA